MYLFLIPYDHFFISKGFIGRHILKNSVTIRRETASALSVSLQWVFKDFFFSGLSEGGSG